MTYRVRSFRAARMRSIAANIAESARPIESGEVGMGRPENVGSIRSSVAPANFEEGTNSGAASASFTTMIDTS